VDRKARISALPALTSARAVPNAGPIGVPDPSLVLNEVVSELMGRYSEPHLKNYLSVHRHRYKIDIVNICELLPRAASIFDFGAYPYAMSETLSRLGYAVTAADIDPSTCPFIHELSFAVVKCNANTARIPIEDQQFDAVVMTEVFEHLHMNPIVTMREVLRILKPDGALYLTTPNGVGLRKLVKVLIKRKFQQIYHQWSSLESTGVMGHVTEYTPAEIKDFLEKTGFTQVTTRTANVYKKDRKIEHYFWKAASFPFRTMRETIIATARK
jgi:SAM-dependent methyltransferase